MHRERTSALPFSLLPQYKLAKLPLPSRSSSRQARWNKVHSHFSVHHELLCPNHVLTNHMPRFSALLTLCLVRILPVVLGGLRIT